MNNYQAGYWAIIKLADLKNPENAELAALGAAGLGTAGASEAVRRAPRLTPLARQSLKDFANVPNAATPLDALLDYSLAGSNLIGRPALQFHSGKTITGMDAFEWRYGPMRDNPHWEAFDRGPSVAADKLIDEMVGDNRHKLYRYWRHAQTNANRHPTVGISGEPGRGDPNPNIDAATYKQELNVELKKHLSRNDPKHVDALTDRLDALRRSEWNAYSAQNFGDVLGDYDKNVGAQLENTWAPTTVITNKYKQNALDDPRAAWSDAFDNVRRDFANAGSPLREHELHQVRDRDVLKRVFAAGDDPVLDYAITRMHPSLMTYVKGHRKEVAGARAYDAVREAVHPATKSTRNAGLAAALGAAGLAGKNQYDKRRLASQEQT